MKTLAAAITAAVLIASPALAHRAPASNPTPFSNAGFSTGPIYSGGAYLGQDPDPGIRSELLRQGKSWNAGG